jgi:predicted nucleic acid-binding protein
MRSRRLVHRGFPIVAEHRYLVDSSVWGRVDLDEVANRIEDLSVNGRLWTCRAVDLEVTYSARSRDVAKLIQLREQLAEAPITPEVMNRALQVAGLMASRGLHRGAKPMDLIVAAAAEAKGLSVLHYDDDYDRIAKVTHQPVEWIARAGTLDH